MKKLVVAVLAGCVLIVSSQPAEAGRYYRGGRGNFWGGFAAGAITGAVTGALLRPPVVVVPPAVVGPPPVVARRAYGPRRVWVPGAYVVRYKPCGTPYRAWRRGYYR